MIDSYFKFKKDLTKKTKFNLVSYSKPVYEPLNFPVIYQTITPEHINAHSKRKSDFGISAKGKWLSQVYIPDFSNRYKGFGDVKGTQDLILFNLSTDEIELFILRGKKNYAGMIMTIFLDNKNFIKKQ